ncbi:5-hydroxytryptamine receptor 4-like [Ornithodoros turicata]|uniref:5-hydroxytryptamine receptor 4-like n=1 Tax=Ornithodoros turicata TaxID=34597 RepID=UPI00313A014E
MGTSSPASFFVELLKRVPQKPANITPTGTLVNATDALPLWMPYQNNGIISILLYGTFSLVGTMLNIFQISALMIQENLRRRGNVLLANQALANLLVTSVGFPVTIVAILANTQQETFVCHWQWYSTLLGFYASVFNFLFIAAENYVRTCRQDSNMYSSVCGTKLVVFLVSVIWAIAIAWLLVVMLVTGGMDVCLWDMRESKMLIALSVPFVLTAVVFVKAMHEQRDYTYNLELRNCLATREEILQRSLLRTNAMAYLLFLLLWLPFLLTVIISPPERNATSRSSALESIIFVAQCFSSVCGFVYAFSHDAFRQGFLYLLHYFCCKSHPEFSKVPVGDMRERSSVRVHGMDSRVGERRHRYAKTATMGLLSFAAGGEACRTRIEEDFL